MKKYVGVARWVLVGLLVVFVVRVFFYQTVRVKDYHMASTIMPGNLLIVNKFKTGYRFPMSVTGLPGVRLKYHRLPGIKNLRLNDVVVFNNPNGSDQAIDRKRKMISRIMGLPSDTVMIRDKQVYVNNIAIPAPVTGRIEYRVVTDGQPIPLDFLKKYHIEKPREIASVGIYDVDLPKDAVAPLEKTPGIKNVRETKLFLGDAAADYYPESNFFKWNRDQFGPFRVPSKGMTVDIEFRSIDFYRTLIETHEGHDVLVDFAGIHIDGKLVTSYTFEKDYYFVLSDNRDNPDDSRKIGFVPADHIVGVVRR